MKIHKITEPVGRLLRSSCQWRLIGLLLECPRPGWAEEAASLADACEVEALRTAAASARNEADEGLYHTTFGPGGPAAPREISYRTSAVPGRFLAQLQGVYNAFGYRPSAGDPPDHVAVETGLIAYLRMKQAHAEMSGDAPGAAACAAAAERVIEEHLSWIAEPLGQSLEHSGVHYLAHAAAELHRRVGSPRQAPAAPLALDVLAGDDPVHCPGRKAAPWEIDGM